MTVTISKESHQTGGFRELLALFFPILLITFSNYLFLFIEKLLLARLSIPTMEAAVNVAYVCQIFQAPCVALSMMTQVFVGRWFGAQEWKSIGSGVWQFIWFAFLSMVITVPCSLLYGHFYFQGTDLQEIVRPYFLFLTLTNFLFPLAATLTCFYIGRGKTQLVLFGTLATQFLKLILGYLFIFGWGWIPSFGILGGAISTLISQGGFCLLLFLVFINSKNSALYHSREWHFQPRLFWECIRHGLLRASNRVLNFTSWAAIAHLMTAKGGDYLLALSIGGTIFIFLPFLGDAICQAQTTIVSQILGKKNISLMYKAFYSGSLLSLITVLVFAIPLILFPFLTFDFLFPEMILEKGVIQQVFLGIWLCFAFFTFCCIPLSYILAFADTKFSLFMGIFSWINGYLYMYVVMEFFDISSPQFWLYLSLMHATSYLIYLWRMKWLQTRAIKTSLA